MGQTNPGHKIRKISPQEVRAYKRIYKGGIYKRKALRVGVFVATFGILVIGAYLFSSFDSLGPQLAFDEQANLEDYADQKAEMANKAVAGATIEEFVATADRIEIPKLGVIGNVRYPQTEDQVNDLLDLGIVHLPQTAAPGNPGLNVYTAHSSSEAGGYYSRIFSTLDKLKSGDIVMLYKERDVFLYKVYKKEVIGPRLEYLKPEKTEEVALITCWPLGTDERRLVIYGERIK